MNVEDMESMGRLFDIGLTEEGLKFYAEHIDPEDALAIDVFINSFTLVDRNFTANWKKYHDKIYNILSDSVKVTNYRCALRIARYELLYIENYIQQHLESI